MRQAFKLAVAALLALFLTACSSVSELQPAGGETFPPSYSVTAVTVEDKTGKFHDLEDGADVEALMHDAMQEALLEAGKVGESSAELTYQIYIIQYQKGSALARWMMPGMGKTILSVEGLVKDSSGTVLATTQATESIGAGGGYTAGAWKYIFGNVAEKLVNDLP